MTNFYKYFILSAILFTSVKALSQEGNFIFFDKTKTILNSSFSGSEAGTTLVAGHQKRIENWNAQYLLFSNRVNENIGIGASIMREEIFVQKNTSLFANFSYNIALERDNKIYFGIRAGGNIYNVDASNLRTYNELGLTTRPDPLLHSYSNKFQPNIGVGIHYQTSDFFAGISIPNLLTSNEVTLNNGQISRVANHFRMNILGGYYWHIKENFTIKPYTQIIYLPKNKTVVELASSFDYAQIFELGIACRVKESISIFTLISIPQTGFQLGYGYQMYTTDLAKYTSGSHEFVLQYKF